MALALFMRTACRSYKVSPALTVASKISPISSLAINRTCPLNNNALLTSNSLVNHDVVRGISTSPVRMSGHDHGKLWTIERGVSLLLVPATPIALMFPSIATDVLMAVSLVMHVHWGLEAIAVDYIRTIIFGSAVPKITLGLVYLLSVATLVGLLNLIFNGAGFANSIRELWKL